MRSKGKEAMAKTPNTQGSAPRLRFPGFEGKWQFVPLSQLASRSTLRNSDEKVKRVLTNSAEFGILDQRDYFDKDIADKGNLQNYYVVQKGDFVYNPRISNAAPVGPISQNKIETGVMSPLYTVFRFHSRCSSFFAQYFNSSRWHGFLRANSSTGARHDRMSIGADTFMQLPVPYIASEEQRQITDFFSSIDDCIGNETYKLAALKSYKQGLMQQLFPAEGQLLPRLRLPGFEGDWSPKTLGVICCMQAGTFVSAAKISDEHRDGMHPCYGGNNLRGFTDTYTHEGKFPLIGRQGALCGNLVFVSGQFHATEHALVASPNHGISVDWLYYLLDHLALNRFSTGQAQPGLSVDVLEKVLCSAPNTEDEQKRIAFCLSSADDLVSAQSRKIAALQQHKKGLIQSLFPAMDTHAA